MGPEYSWQTRRASSPLLAANTVYPEALRSPHSRARTCASSSTTRTVSEPDAVIAIGATDDARSADSSAHGRYSGNVVPTPGVLDTRIWPWLCLMVASSIERPSPVPLPGCFVVKN